MPCGAIRAVYFSIRLLGPIRNVRLSISFSLSIRSLIEITLFKRISFSHVGRSHFFPCFVHVISLIRLLPRRISIWLFRRAARIFFSFISLLKVNLPYRTATTSFAAFCVDEWMPKHSKPISFDLNCVRRRRCFMLSAGCHRYKFFSGPETWKIYANERARDGGLRWTTMYMRKTSGWREWMRWNGMGTKGSFFNYWLRFFVFFSPAFSCRFMLMRLNSLENRMNGMTQSMLWFVPSETRQKSKEIMNDDDDEVS